MGGGRGPQRSPLTCRAFFKRGPLGAVATLDPLDPLDGLRSDGAEPGSEVLVRTKWTFFLIKFHISLSQFLLFQTAVGHLRTINEPIKVLQVARREQQNRRSLYSFLRKGKAGSE